MATTQKQIIVEVDRSQPEVRNAPDLSRDEIAKRAFEIHLSRGACHGHDLDDWLQAERELMQTSAASK